MPFSVSDILDAIKDMSAFSAAGPDKFPVAILKECGELLAPIIHKLWCASLETGIIAEKFKSQAVIPIFKGGSKAIPANYRPVSLTSHIIKLFERVVRKKMISFIEEHNLIHPKQHGFRKGRSCLTQLLDHFDDVLRDLNSDANSDVIYLDFSKAFDKVDHRILLKKLHKYGIRGNLHRWLQSFLSDRTQHVVIDGVSSTKTKVVSGVPQGTVLGPLLFLLYVNDIFDAVKNALLKLFADDSKMQRIIHSLFDHELLQKDMESVTKWATSNNMELNINKFQLLQHGKNAELKIPYQLQSGSDLIASKVVKDLGVFVDSNLNWKAHIQTKVNDAAKKAGWVLRTFTTRDKDTMLLLFKSYVRSVVEYCCPLWSPHLVGEITKVEGVQRTFTSKISGCQTLNYWERLKKLDLYSLQRRRERYMIILVWKMEHLLIPNVASLEFRQSGRRGATCKRLLGSSKYSSTNTTIFNSFSSVAPAMYNLVPAQVKNCSTLPIMKLELDRWLQSIPDTPPTPGYLAVNRNSLLEWVGSMRQ